MQPLRVLVVDDARWRIAFCMLLKDIGYEPIHATCGQEFEEQAENADVIILDVDMPLTSDGTNVKTGGLEVLAKLQRSFPDHHAINNPIVRSMWTREEFSGTPFGNDGRISIAHWTARVTPSAQLLRLIEIVGAGSQK